MIYQESTVLIIIAASIPLVALAIFLAIYIPISVRNNRNGEFVKEHSIAYKALLEINTKYDFKEFKDLKLSNSYDNEKYFNTISTSDYLIYYLNYHMKEVQDYIYCATYNKELFKTYWDEVSKDCLLERFDTEEFPDKKERILAMEKKIVGKTIYNPKKDFYIFITLTLTNINGVRQKWKSNSFSIENIKGYIPRIKNRRGNFYLDEGIWNAICRVERGKVTNKLRFAIYNRDHNRCRICGSTRNLEVDHIIPIAKGGKTTFNNLQTLCHRCNQRKGSSL